MVVADDEIHARERLRELLDRCGRFEIVAEAVDGNEALQAIIAHAPDVAFLDINMPGVSVFTSLSSLRAPPLVVFQTAYSEHAAAAFDIAALDYLLKPIRFERLLRTVERIEQRLHARTISPSPAHGTTTPPTDTRLTVKVGDRASVIAAGDIVRISSREGLSHIYTATERFMSDRYLSYYEKKLCDKGFFRAGRTELINLGCIRSIERLAPGVYTVELTNGMKVDLSRRKAQVLRTMVDF